ncbi:MAG: hypothetical protein KKE00_05945 [Proteobacteria bacterium]|nr:hypothetical protein [Pseudomonadota bacterium]MBU1570047.1 hypothetical protein [Pseudomonadota bacterium]
MDKIKYLAFITVLLFCFPVSAEFFKFTGPDGKVYYTDDYNRVPKNQRVKAKGYVGYESDAGSSEPVIKQKTEQGLEEEQGKKSESARTDFSDKSREGLEKKKLELEDEYNALEKERAELERIKNELKTNQQKLQYNSRIQDYNEKLKTYSAKRESLASEAESYNSEIEKSKKRD